MLTGISPPSLMRPSCDERTGLPDPAVAVELQHLADPDADRVLDEENVDVRPADSGALEDLRCRLGDPGPHEIVGILVLAKAGHLFHAEEVHGPRRCSAAAVGRR